MGRVIGSWADAGIFFRGDSGSSEIKKKKALTTFFSLNIFYRSPKVTFKEKLSFSKVPEEVQHFPGGGGPTSFRGGVVSDCLFSIETHITCDFPVSPLNPPMWALR